MEKCNKTIGNGFEAVFCEMLSEQGFWAHNIAQNRAGQPADVIAAKNGKAYLIDCKVVSGDSFPLTRIEANQETAMDLWEMCGNGQGFFAFALDEEVVVMLPLLSLQAERHGGVKAITKIQLWERGIPFERWVEKCK